MHLVLPEERPPCDQSGCTERVVAVLIYREGEDFGHGYVCKTHAVLHAIIRPAGVIVPYEEGKEIEVL